MRILNAPRHCRLQRTDVLARATQLFAKTRRLTVEEAMVIVDGGRGVMQLVATDASVKHVAATAPTRAHAQSCSDT